jgi:hypothetical protein
LNTETLPTPINDSASALSEPLAESPHAPESDWFDLSVADDDAEKEHTWSGRTWFWFNVQAFTIQRFLARQADDVFEVRVEHRRSFEIEPGTRESFICKGAIVHSIKGRLVACHTDCEEEEVTVSAKHDIKGLIARLEAELRRSNPLRGHHVQIVPVADHFRAAVRAVPATRFSDLILDAALVEDLYDNTIFQLKATRLSNGLIFHGEPGTGKSLACQAVAHDAVAEGFSSAFVAGAVDFTLLSEFIAEFLAPCVLVFEDIDCFAGERTEGDGSRDLADFLQFLSGVTGRQEQIIVIATTNHLDRLDKAVQNRPVRFNRKYHFARPSNAELDRLLDLHFGAGALRSEAKRLCHDRRLSGAHIAEIKRTAITLAHKRSQPEAQVFAEAVGIVTRHFGGARRRIGFGA